MLKRDLFSIHVPVVLYNYLWHSGGTIIIWPYFVAELYSIYITETSPYKSNPRFAPNI